MTVKPASEVELRRRAAKAIPGGMYGHNVEKFLWPGAPQFWSRARGSRVWDADGNEYVDLMCGWGPIVLGYSHPEVEAAADRQRRSLDLGNGPAAVFVELAERLIDVVDHADWAVFAKNGTDVTTAALVVARIETARSTALVARGAFHGSAPWCHSHRPGVTSGERASIAYYDYNDAESLRTAVAEHGDDLAAILLTPHRHDAAADQELIDPEFAREVRRLCDVTGAVLVLDEVRTGFRLAFGSSWAHLGVEPDLSCWSKAIGNGHPVSALLGRESLRAATSAHLLGGTFWTSAVPLAASLATLRILESEGAAARMAALGETIADGIVERARHHGVGVRLTGPPAMPYLAFDNDPAFTRAKSWAAAVAAAGLYVNPSHNWFISSALDAADVKLILNAADAGFATVAGRW
ncbi:hypothetical protein ASF72_19075 [Arthrobacter sp. Leaf141]|uniref:aminotransferase class III-fold pyridoxal phosphate-dependent enzyme n=1 Tax=unclassified Arthrobacter TaxID=235627 RepID=UPI0006FC63DA|nr:aminotransferase class III-fold pyridoxal phosphate-dependent enzyme [Arthrobacter sp. Leaf141]KQQ96197.1 hypothetical protein ASF72_19075 [Arthrobacter sp. Leaf141]